MKVSSLGRGGFASQLMQQLAAAVTVLAVLVCWSPVARADGCDPNDPFLVDVINVICALTGGGLGGCVSQSDTCAQVTTDLFTGATLDVNNPIGPNPKWCELGGRGEIMGEAALCLLRDLAQPAVSPSQGGPGITISPTPISLGPLGDASVTQRVGFLSFDVPSRTMNGYHDVSLCVPAFGCVSDETQPFTASLVHFYAVDLCEDYPVTGGYRLSVVAADNEHDLQTTISPIIVYTPIGPVTAQPQFAFGTHLKAVTSPYADPATVNQVRQFYMPFIPLPKPTPPLGCDPERALLQDVYDDDGIPLTVHGGKPPVGSDMQDGGRGWDSQLALGGRDADPNSLLWTPDVSKTRPDLDQGQARKVDEKKFVGNAGASLPIAYDPSKLIPSFLNQYPFHLELSLSVTPAVAASFASQFNAYLAEGSFRPLPQPTGDCFPHIFDATSLEFQSRVDADAAFTLTIEFKFILTVSFIFGSKELIYIDNPITPVSISDRQSQDGPPAGAKSMVLGDGNPAPPASPTYDMFTSFSGGPGVDGAQFVAACLTEPPPTPQPLPQPGYVPGDPNKLVPQLQYPCNVCIAYDNTGSACVQKQQPWVEPDPCKYDVNGFCVDTSGQNGCEVQPLPTPLPGGTTVMFPAPQPAGKQWLCDSSSKLGCYDLCTYDPSSQTPLVVVQSAMDLHPGLNCNAQTSGKPCGNNAQCDDQNPCTDDFCGGGGEFHHCEHTAHDGIPCDDGLFCDGTDTCYLGACSQHSGNPCASGSDPGCCDESAGACRQSCDPKVCGDGIIEFGEQCDDNNTTSGDGCSANCTVETGFSCVGQPSICALLSSTPTPTPAATPTPTHAGAPIPVIPSPTAPAGLLLIIVLIWLLFRTVREMSE